jgi:protein-disulfide isomerase
MNVLLHLFACIFCLFAMLIQSDSAWAVVDSGTNTDLEQTILRVIEKHPEAIFKSLSSYQQQQQTQQQQVALQALQQIERKPLEFVGASPVRGDRTAKLLLVEFADFQCPFCVRAHQPIQQLLKRYPEIGFVYKHLPLVDLHDQAIPAAQAAWAAGKQGKFWQYYDALFESDALTEERYDQIANQLKLNMLTWQRDRKSNASLDAIQLDSVWAEQLGITGTPFFLVISPSGVRSISGADIPAIEAQIRVG